MPGSEISIVVKGIVAKYEGDCDMKEQNPFFDP